MKNKWLRYSIRLIGISMLLWAIWMYKEDISYSSSFDTYQGLHKEHKEIVIDHWKLGIIGLIITFSHELIRYLNYVKYGYWD